MEPTRRILTASAIRTPSASSTPTATGLPSGDSAHAPRLLPTNTRRFDAGARVRRSAGLTLIDTSTWKLEMVQRDATTATRAGGTLLASTTGYPELRGIGLRGYDLDGRQRFHLFGTRAVSVLARLDERVFVVGDGGLTRAVDARTGCVELFVHELPELLVGSMRRY